MSAAADGTLLNPGAGGDTIATEDLPVGAARGSSDAPATDYKIGRSKIAVGGYGKDAGDVGPENALDVRMLNERRLLEELLVNQMNVEAAIPATRQRDRISYVDRRGNTGRGSVR